MDSEAKNEQALAIQGAASLAPTGGRQGAMVTAFQGLIPTSIGEAYALAGYLAKSKAIPSFYRDKPDTILTVILAGLEIGLTPIRSLNNLTNISGNLGMKADLQLALVRRSGLLDFYDEGFEVRGRTDSDLAARTQDGAKILALVKAVPDGKPYGWASAQRKGDRTLTTRTFTWTDAETAEIWEKDEDGGERKKTKLSAKFNYVAFPADMYPKRARGRVLQITHSDVLAGMLSSEALEGGQVPVIDVEPAYTAEDMLGEAGDEQAQAITAGFDFLEFSPARRVQKLAEYRGRFPELITYLRDEAGQRKGQGKVGTARKARAAAPVIDAQPAAPTQPAAQAPAPEAQPAAPAAAPSPEPAAGPVPVAPAAPTPQAAPDAAQPAQPAKSTKAADAAAKFRERFGVGSSF
jgi:hypothetical protein